VARGPPFSQISRDGDAGEPWEGDGTARGAVKKRASGPAGFPILPAEQAGQMASLIIGLLDWAGVARTVADHYVTVHPARPPRCAAGWWALFHGERGWMNGARTPGNTPTVQRVAS
jgi:hypothetical protein